MLWIWLGIAFALLIAEVLTGTFYMLVIAFGFALGSIAAMFGWSLTWQVLIISLGILAGLLGLKYLGVLRKGRKSPQENVSFDIGQTVSVTAWDSRGVARVRYRGTDWDAEIADESPQIVGDYTVVATSGNTLKLSIKTTGK